MRRLLAFAAGLAAWAGAEAAACSCSYRGDDVALREAFLVFEGEAVSADTVLRQVGAWNDGAAQRTVFKVSRVVKGSQDRSEVVLSSDLSTSCAYPIDIGTKARIYAWRDDEGGLWTGFCSGNHYFELPGVDAEADAARYGDDALIADAQAVENAYDLRDLEWKLSYQKADRAREDFVDEYVTRTTTDSSDPRDLTRAMLAAQEYDDHERVTDLLIRLLAVSPRDALRVHELAERAMKAGLAEKALPIAERVLAELPDDPVVQANAGRLRLAASGELGSQIGYAGGVYPEVLLPRRADGLDFSASTIRKLSGQGVRARGLRLERAKAEGSLDGADLRGANFRYLGTVPDEDYAGSVDLTLRGADLRDADLTGARFADSDFENARMDRVRAEGAHLGGWRGKARMRGVSLVEASLVKAVLHDADLRGDGCGRSAPASVPPRPSRVVRDHRSAAWPTSPVRSRTPSATS